MVVYRAHESPPSAAYHAEARTFRLARGRLLAVAGRDRTVDQGAFVRLNGRATRLANRSSARAAQADAVPSVAAITYRWQIASAPDGSTATLDDPTSAAPSLQPDRPGDYAIRLTTTEANGATSTDTVTVTVRADVPPIGAPLHTVADDRGTITLNGEPVADTTQSCDPGDDGRGCAGRGSWAVWERRTLAPVASGNGMMDAGGLKALADLADRYNAAPSYLMVVNLQGVTGASADGQRLFKTLGVTDLSAGDLANTLSIDRPAPVSIAGMPGSPAGSAFVSNHFLAAGGAAARHEADLSGYLRLNPVAVSPGIFEFVFTDQLQFDTDADPSNSRITMKVGEATFSASVPDDGTSGFYVVQLDSLTLDQLSSEVFQTNVPTGGEILDGPARMAASLADATAPRAGNGERLVLIQSFGAPKGTSQAWTRVGMAIEELGGTRQVLVQLNNGSAEQPGKGPYAFVGRTGLTGPAPESSRPLTGNAKDGRLQGLLARGRDAQYQSLIADPLGSVNFDLVRIVNRPTAADGGFPKFTDGEAAAATALGRNPDVLGVCPPAPVPCNVRKAYYGPYDPARWQTNLTRLGSDVAKDVCAKGEAAYTPDECDHVRQQLALEIGRRNDVDAYFRSLQRPFGTAQVQALADIGAISAEINRAVPQAAGGNATSNALSILSFVVRFAALAGPQASAAASGVGAAFGLGAYLTRESGSPNLIGPEVSQRAGDLGRELFVRYQNVSASFATLGKIVMSDYAKLTEVAAASKTDPAWQLDDIETSGAMMQQATTTAIYQSLVPVAWPVLYDLGWGRGYATQWTCISRDAFLYDKRLFQNTGPGAQIAYRFPGQPPADAHVIAVGGTHATLRNRSAFIPAPPADLTTRLFGDPLSPQGGLGLNKLQFYSPRYFRMFSPVLQQRRGTFIQDGADYGYGFYTCQSMPDPPGNSE